MFFRVQLSNPCLMYVCISKYIHCGLILGFGFELVDWLCKLG